MALKSRLVFPVVVCAALSMAMWFAIGKAARLHPRRITETAIVTMEGARVSSVFEGSSPDPRNDLRRIPNHAPPVIRCSARVNRTLLDRIKGFFEPSVFADGSCPTTRCGSDHYVNFR